MSTRRRPARPKTVVAAVQQDIKALDRDAQGSALALTALALARDIDAQETSPTARSMCARSITEVLRELRTLSPASKEKDGLDTLTARRNRRRARSAAASNPPRS